MYVNSNYTVRNNTLISKHVFTGNTRVCSKVSDMEMVDGTSTRVDKGIYYYHGDHLGSSSVITDRSGGFYEHLEYFPYGEVWVNERVSADVESVPYKFTGKEYDPETGLYNYGHRSYDPTLGRWISADPALEKYMPSPNDFDTEHDYFWYIGNDKSQKLPGIGGVFNAVNLDLYHYAGNNPVLLIDPNGRDLCLSFDFDIPVGFFENQYPNNPDPNPNVDEWDVGRNSLILTVDDKGVNLKYQVSTIKGANVGPAISALYNKDNAEKSINVNPPANKTTKGLGFTFTRDENGKINGFGLSIGIGSAGGGAVIEDDRKIIHKIIDLFNFKFSDDETKK